jgi:hypothetical protein
MDLTRRSALVLGAASAAAALVPSGASAHPGHPGTGNPFVTRDGGRLRLAGRPFRFAGTNIYWLGLDENVGGVGYPTYFRIRDALDTAAAMGFTVVRSHMMASTGNPLSILPARDAGFNAAAFATVDYAIAHAGAIGIRLILPLTDEWSYYHGGHRDFTNPYGLPSEAFYTDPRVVADYQAYVHHVMHRVNPLTGVAYHQDPAIMAWEFGNELEGMTRDWLAGNAARFRQWAPRQLIAAGRRFDIDPDTLAVPDIDIVDVHYYPPTAARVKADAATVTAAGKVYVGGEYASTAATADLLTPLAADPAVTGMLSWSLFGHHDRGGFVAHDDGFTMHYPGDDARMRAAVDAQVAFAAALQPAPARRFSLAPPLITEIGKRGGFDVVRWRGTAGAAGYRVERAHRERGPWTAAHDGLLTDRDAPWTDPTASGGTWFRVVPVDRTGRPGAPADPVQAGASDVVLVDPLEDFTLTSAHTAVAVTAADGFAVVRPTGAGACVGWTRPGIRAARFDVVTAGRRPAVSVEVSADGVTWRAVRTHVSPGVRRYTVTAATPGAAHVRFGWPAGSTAGLARATLWSADPAPVHAPPAAARLTAPAPGATGVIGPAAFTWTEAAGAGLYTLTVSRQADLGNPVLTATGLTATSYLPTAGLPPATTFHWRVGAANARGTTHSDTATFTTRAVPTAPVTVDDFDGYADAAALAAAYPRNPGGDPITPTLTASATGRAMRLDFTLAAAGYAGVSRTFTTPLDVWGQAGLECHLDRSGTTAGITIQFVTSGIYWEHTLPAGTGAGVVRIPFSEFKHPSWAPSGPLDLLHLGQLSVYVGGSGPGTLVVDSLVAYPPGE